MLHLYYNGKAPGCMGEDMVTIIAFRMQAEELFKQRGWDIDPDTAKRYCYGDSTMHYYVSRKVYEQMQKDNELCISRYVSADSRNGINHYDLDQWIKERRHKDYQMTVIYTDGSSTSSKARTIKSICRDIENTFSLDNIAQVNVIKIEN